MGPFIWLNENVFWTRSILSSFNRNFLFNSNKTVKLVCSYRYYVEINNMFIVWQIFLILFKHYSRAIILVNHFGKFVLLYHTNLSAFSHFRLKLFFLNQFVIRKKLRVRDTGCKINALSDSVPRWIQLYQRLQSKHKKEYKETSTMKKMIVKITILKVNITISAEM